VHTWITVDGIDIRELTLAICAAVQSGAAGRICSAGTIAENIRPAARRSTTSDEARGAGGHAEPFIARLPDGYASAVAERGSTLSVGRRAAVVRARAGVRSASSSRRGDVERRPETEIIIRDAAC
jgi:ABC-type multidrug transport system fused ATPase/permease subunit